MSPTRRDIIKAAGGVAALLTLPAACTSVEPAIAAPKVQLSMAMIEPTQAPSLIAEPGELVERFSGHWSTYDHTNRIFLGNSVELWATRTTCGMTCRTAGGDDLGERIEFEDPKIAWAFTCMMRLMRGEGLRPD